MLLIYLAALFSDYSYSAPTIDAKKVFAVTESDKAAIEDVKLFRDFYISVESDFESYNPPFKAGAKPNIVSYTDQLTSFKSVKDRKDDAVEVRFEKLVTKNEMQIPGTSKPFTTNQDLSSILKNKSFFAIYKNNELENIEGLNKLKESLKREIKDPITKHSILMTFDEPILKKTVEALRQEPLCAMNIKGKKPGEEWTQIRKEQNVDVTYKCKFKGWSQNGKNKVAVIDLAAPKQQKEQKQPNGVIGVVEVESKGELIYDPKIPEVRITINADIFAEPTKREITKLEKQKKFVPRNKSKMKALIQQYPM
ncbi:MAG: hypothetical protein M9962_08830 [Oligoflexia bacterium]|nr:hypothetical protein [Oligoflexia bacterium]